MKNEVKQVSFICISYDRGEKFSDHNSHYKAHGIIINVK